MGKLNSILLVDDDSVSNTLNTAILSKLNITNSIEVVNNGRAAINYLLNAKTNQLPDLILLDINMPSMDGFDFLEEFDKLVFDKKESIKIMILTSSDDLTDLRRCLSYNLYGYIVKPLNEKKILTLIGN